jgi:hypothetical protein
MRTITFALGGLGAVAVIGLAAGGCELIAAVDHDLINTGGSPSTGGAGGATSSTTGTMGGCMFPEDCPMPPNDCVDRTCDAMMCGQANAPAGDPCQSGGGQVCDGNGTCVECVTNAQCTPPEVCDTDVNECVSMACLNMMQDPGETDVDCGGMDCGPCMIGEMCLVGTDCTTGYCDGTMVCAACTAPGNCAANQWCNTATGNCEDDNTMNGTTCTVNEQCPNNVCASTSEGMLCCDMACSGCRSCASNDNGGTDGVCGNVTAGIDPANACGAADCQADNCDGAGMCGNDPGGTPCGQGPTCVGDSLKSQDTCNAGGSCVAGSQTPCANNFTCDTVSCFAAPCSAHTQCIATHYCVGAGGALGMTMGDCEAKKAAAAACAVNEECQSGTCMAGMCT